MKLARLILLVPFILLITLQLSGCAIESAKDTNESVTVRVVVTEDFGNELLLEQKFDVPAGSSAMSSLKQVAEVETSYGGGFVDSINGLSSGYTGRAGKKLDWFVYFNGIMSKTGALDYTIRSGDVQSWDYHDWNCRMFTPAVIGYYPEPFLHGYAGMISPTVIVYDSGYDAEASSLETALLNLGVDDVSSSAVSELSDSTKESANIILIGEVDSNALLSELNDAWDRLGFFARFSDGIITVYSGDGSVTSEYGPGTGVIQATQSPWNPKGTGACENVVWMVSGTDVSGVRSSVDILVNHHDRIEYAFAVVAVNGSVIKVPH